MREDEGSQAPKQSKRPAQDFFTVFGFSTKRGLYLPKTIINTDRPNRQQEHNSKRIFRILRGWVPFLTFIILAANAVIYAQQCGIMKKQAITIATQAATMEKERQGQEGASVGIAKVSAV
jgi:hypothetical protein